MSGISNIPIPHNEPVLTYAPGTPERAALKSALGSVAAEPVDIPVVVGGREIRTGDTHDVVSPHCHRRVLAKVHQADAATIASATKAAVEAQRDWAHWRFEDRAAVFLKAADLLATAHRQLVNAATMLGQSKTAFQAEIDSACELIDFLRFNVHFADQIYREQPESSSGVWNRMDHRPLEGFVYAITPFNFTAIGGNLPTAPALMGNAVVWKPSATAALSNWYFYRILEEAGLPPGVINFLPGDSIAVSRTLLADREAGRHSLHRIDPRVPESLAHGGRESRPLQQLPPHRRRDRRQGLHRRARRARTSTRSRWAWCGAPTSTRGRSAAPRRARTSPIRSGPQVRERVAAMIADIRMGDVADFRNFMGAVIDRRAFDRLRGHLERAKTSAGVKVVAGGGTDDSTGWFVQPTLLQVDDPMYRTMCEELFGPVLTVHVYPAAKWTETLALVDRTGPYALTGAVFAQDRAAVVEADRALRFAAGNYYINDKPTGAVVGQQPFGGGRASGTNDKAGSVLNLLRWVSPRSIKETFAPPKDYRYPFMAEG